MGDYRSYIETLITIPTKTNQIVPFVLNRAQAHYWEHRTNRDIILKARQLGFSTLKLAEYLVKTMFVPGTITTILSYEAEQTKRLLGRLNHMYRSIPKQLRVSIYHDTEHRKTFPDVRSEIFIATAGAKVVGRGDTITHFHGSEIAFWENPERIMTAILGSVPSEGTITLESTPRGEGNYYHKEAQKALDGMGEFVLRFYPWWWGDDYRLGMQDERIPRHLRAELCGDLELTDEELNLVELHGLDEEQIRWRRRQIITFGDEFWAEYPEDTATCFFSSSAAVFDLDLLKLKASLCYKAPQSWQNVDVWHPPEEGMLYLIGCDSSEGVSDPCAATVWTLTGDPVHCATLYGKMNEELFAPRIAELGKHYNGALLAVEDNGSGRAVLALLKGSYPNLYKRKHIVSGKRREEYGWRTSYQTKAFMVSTFRDTLATLDVHDMRVIRQARNLRKDDKTLKKDKIISLSEDDVIMSAMIALAVRTGQQPIKRGWKGNTGWEW